MDLAYQTQDIHILVVNLDNTAFTRNCVLDLMRQIDGGFDLTVVDNGSVEDGTREWLARLKPHGVNVIEYSERVPLNWIWNDFYKSTSAPLLSFLNNDVRIACNHVSDMRAVFAREPRVGLVGHVTNNPEYSSVRDLHYVLLYRQMRQGWDFTVRREAYNVIPHDMRVFYGDDYLYEMLYRKEWQAAMILSSPMIHYLGQSGKATSRAEFDSDGAAFAKYIPNYSVKWSGYSIGKPPLEGVLLFRNELRPFLTVNIVTYGRHEELKRLVAQYLNQTDRRFLLDIWQDGPDPAKRRMIEDFNDQRIHYNENPRRQNRYGHDMRNKSIAACETEWWCTTNDDNMVSPLFVEEVGKHRECDLVKISVAMANLRKSADEYNENWIAEGETDFDLYAPYMKVLDPALDTLGDVDACSFVVRTELIKKIGWKSMRFEGDWNVYSEILSHNPRMKRIKTVLKVHN